MAIQISGTTIINNTKELDTGLKSVWPEVEVSDTNATVPNRTFRVVTDNDSIITLPANPEIGNEVCVLIQGNFLRNVVARNGEKIMEIDEDITMNIRNAGVTFVYTGTTVGWRIY